MKLVGKCFSAFFSGKEKCRVRKKEVGYGKNTSRPYERN